MRKTLIIGFFVAVMADIYHDSFMRACGVATHCW
jgi:hypothetical protein